MFNEYENDGDEFTEPVDYTTEFSSEPLMVDGALEDRELTIADVLGLQRFYYDRIISRISTTYEAISYDMYGYLTPEFYVHTHNIQPVDGKPYGDLTELGNGGVGIYINKVHDAYTAGGESYNSEFTLYSPVHAFSTQYPKIYETEKDIVEPGWVETPEGYGVWDSAGSIQSEFKVSYYDAERAGLNEKYAMLPGIELHPLSNPGHDTIPFYDNLDEILYDELERQFSSMASQIYQTMINREYVPQIIKNNVSFSAVDLKTTLGVETSDPLMVESLAVEYTAAPEGSSPMTMGTMGGMGSTGGGGTSSGY